MSDAAALVRQLRSCSRLAQLQALRSIADLAVQIPDARPDAIAAGSVAAIMQLSGLSGGGAVQEAAAHALCALSLPAEAPTLAAFADAGAIPLLVSMLQHSLDSGDAAVQESAADALWHLAALDGGPATVEAAGAIPPLVALLLARRGQPILKTDSAAAGALGAIGQTGNLQLALEIVRHGSVPALATVIERRTLAGPVEFFEERALVRAATALGALADFEEDCQEPVVAAGSVRPLASLLSHGSFDVQLAAAGALRAVLAGCKTAVAEFTEAQAVPIAAGVLHSTSQPMQRDATGMLSNAAADNAANSAEMLAAGAMQQLVQLLRTPGHPGHEWAAVTVGSLCRMQPEAAIAAIQQAGGRSGCA